MIFGGKVEGFNEIIFIKYFDFFEAICCGFYLGFGRFGEILFLSRDVRL